MFYVVSLSFLAGVLLHSLPIPAFLGGALFLGGVLIFLPAARHKKLFALCFALLFVLLGWVRFEQKNVLYLTMQKEVFPLFGDEVDLVGVVSEEPVQKERFQNVMLTSVEIVFGAVRHPTRGAVLISTPLYPRVYIGETLYFSCDFEKPLDDHRYFERRRIVATCWFPDFKNIHESAFKKKAPSWIRFKARIMTFKNSLIAQVSRIISSPHNILLSGLLFGDIAKMPPDLKDAFIQTGTVHIMAISGYNITILMSIFFRIAPFLYLTRRRAWFVVVPLLFVFVVMTGAQSSVIRAGIMGIIA